MTNELQYNHTDLLEIGKLHKLHSNFWVRQFHSFAHASFGVSCRKTDQSLQGSSSDRWRLRTKHSRDSSNSLPESIRTFPNYLPIPDQQTNSQACWVCKCGFIYPCNVRAHLLLAAQSRVLLCNVIGCILSQNRRNSLGNVDVLPHECFTHHSVPKKTTKKYLALYKFIILQKFK